MRWSELPQTVREEIEQVLGSPVVAGVSQSGGFSNGVAERVRTAAGGAAFVKAISTQMNGGAAALNRTEARIGAALPPDVPVPRLLGHHDDGTWVVLVFEDVDGRQPAIPWTEPDLARALKALETLADRLTPCPLADVPDAVEALAEPLDGWERIAALPPNDLDPWIAERLPVLRRAVAVGRAGLGGDTLVHFDVRADNILIRGDGNVVVVDWPWACRGPAWLDTLMLCADVFVNGGHDLDGLLRRGVTAHIDPTVLEAVLIGLAGYALDASRLPAPPGMDRLRPFQRAKADGLLTWIRRQPTFVQGPSVTTPRRAPARGQPR
jgi:aminoglycoside phosphotransferase (APT) family kinase protein